MAESKHITVNKSNNINDVLPVSLWLYLSGDAKVRPYANDVYKGVISINEVPEELRESVQIIVDRKIAYYGSYENSEISDSEALEIIVGGTQYDT